jgi:tetratricopeptide (TPR) repeat protein
MVRRYLCVFSVFTFPFLLAEGSNPDQTWRALILQAQKDNQGGQAVKALEIAKRALPVAQSFGPHDSRLAVTYQVLGKAYLWAGDCAQSRANYSRALTMWLAQPTASNGPLFSSVFGLINQSYICQDYPTAQRLFRKYSALLEHHGAGAVDAARLATLEAEVARAQRHYPEAEAHLREALREFERSPAEQAREIARTEGALGQVIGQQGRPQEALEHEMKALATLRQIAPRNLDTVSALNNVGLSLAALNRLSEAEQHFEQALALALDVFGENSRLTAPVMFNYARVLRSDNRTRDAEQMSERANASMRHAALSDSQVVGFQELKLGLR